MDRDTNFLIAYIRKVRWTVGILVILVCTEMYAQHDIKLINPSFEDTPVHSVAPAGWINCGFTGESPPDIQPNGEWGVHRPPYHGISYMGMVARENDTWELVGQQLSDTLTPGQCYYFNIYLCTSPIYKSAVKKLNEAHISENPELKDFTQPIRLRIWGGNAYCEKTELLAQSETVENHEWKIYHFKFKPEQAITHLVLEAFFKTPTLFPYNGNLLLDKASDISPIDCDQERPEVLSPIVEFLQPIEKINPDENLVRVQGRIRYVDSQNDIRFIVNSRSVRNFKFNASNNRFEAMVNLKEGRNDLYLYGRNEGGADSDQTNVYIQTEEDETLASVDDSVGNFIEPSPEETPDEFTQVKQLNYLVRKGQKIEIENLRFANDSDSIYESSIDELMEVYYFMKKNEKFVIEISGHTRMPPVNVSSMEKDQRELLKNYHDDLSLDRAKSVAQFLITQGIDSQRIRCKGYGFTRPIVHHRSLDKFKNQRVEIKILSTG